MKCFFTVFSQNCDKSSVISYLKKSYRTDSRFIRKAFITTKRKKKNYNNSRMINPLSNYRFPAYDYYSRTKFWKIQIEYSYL